MTTKVVPGQLVATFDAEHVAREASKRIARALRDAISARSSATMALSGGNTPRATYERLAKEPGVEWSKVAVFWIDERAVPAEDDRSNYRWAKESLLDKVPIPAEGVHRMPGDAKDLEQAARDYEALLRKTLRKTDAVPSFDVVVLGVGDDGHTASLFPGEATVEITDRLVVAVPAKPPSREARLTVTAPVIENARSVFILAVGKAKQPALERVWSTSGSIRETPARVIRSIRGGVTWVIDKAAGGLG
jgi:6-phosphogluconolactonase